VVSFFPLNIQADLLNELDALSRSRQYFDLRDRIKQVKSGEPEVVYYRAQVAEKFNQPAEANRLYKLYLDASAKRREESMRAMAFNYAKLGAYRQASETYRALDRSSPDADLANVRKLWGALSHIPPQTVAFPADSDIPISRSFNVPIVSNGQSLPFIFDTGANISTVSESYAKRLGLIVIPSRVMVGGITGASTPARLGVSKHLRLGNAVVRNAVFLIFADKDLFIKSANFQLNGILGFPVISAMREITLTRDGRLKIPAKPKSQSIGNLALDGLTPLVLGRYGSHRLTFALDSGANTSMLYPAFLGRFERAVSIWESGTHRFAGVGSAAEIPAYIGKDLKLRIGGQDVNFARIPVLKQTTTANSRTLHGNLGQDMIRQFESMTLNFKTMSLTFGPRVH